MIESLRNGAWDEIVWSGDILTFSLAPKIKDPTSQIMQPIASFP